MVQKMADDQMPSGFSLSLALVDLIPEVLFLGLGLTAAEKTGSVPVFLGAVLCVCAGLMKAFWKMFLALRGTDRKLLPVLFRILLPAGFVMMIAGFIAAGSRARLLFSGMLRGAALGFFLAGCAGMAAMVVFMVKVKQRSSVRGNWIEEWTNIFMQGMFLISMLLA